MDKLATSQIKLLNLKDWRKNWGLKLISFLFAIVLWYFVVGVDKVDRTFTIPVETADLPENIIITNQFKKELEIRVTGPLGLIRKMEQGNLSRTVDLSGASPGSLVIKNTAENLPIPNGVRLRNVTPRNIILTLDRLIDKKIPVAITTSGQPEPGYKITSIEVSPEKIHVTGPQTLLENLDKFSSEPIKLNNRSSSFRVSTALDIPESVTELIGEPVVDAHIIIKEKKEEKEK